MRRSVVRSLLAAALACSLAACAKAKPAPDPTCDQVVDNMLAVTKQQLTGHGDLELGNRKVMIAQCEQRALTAAQRRCLATAKDLAAIAGCTPAKPASAAAAPGP